MSTVHCRWLFLLFFLTTWTSSNSKEVRVVCYYTNWSVYRPGTAKFSPQNINPYLCTHLIYAFGGFTKENTLKPFDKYQDIEKGGYAKFTGLKTYNKNLKTMLAIGGWNEGSSRFSPMVASPERRKEFIKNSIKFLRQNHFDGLDLDWEYPSFRDGGKSRDKDNYALLVQEMREEFERESEKTGRPRLLLTMAVPAGIEYINKGYDVPKLTKYLDWMNILSYDYHSAFEPAVNNHAPLYPLEEPSEYNYDTELNIDYTIKHYLEKGADPNKLVLGIPTYGRSYTLFNPDANEVGAPADGPGDMGEATRENGYLAYYEICENVKSQNWEVVQPNPEAMGPYAFKGNQWVGYDDEAIARKKASYVAENNLGGIMFWSIDNDDFRGNCHGKPYPIIEAAKEALIKAYGLTDENLVSQPKPTKSKTKRPQLTKSSEKSDDENKSVSTRRNRVKAKPERNSSSSRLKSRRKEARTTTEGTVYSSLELVTPSYTTPAPPPTPGMGGEFKCEDEGFYPHPKDCKKYFWCLSGPGELGIVAHQFTCPAGLYFNKAADSCDYTRNVLCSKKLTKTTTTTTTTPSTTTAATSTARVPPKITAATSRTTVFRTTTTTEAYEEDYEYEDEEEDAKNSEEDPKVIKELLDLIRKAGGIEQLEKQLKIQEDGSASVSSSDTTTPSSISKSLVERVLGKAAKNKGTERKNFLINRNSRGPQNAGLESTEEKQKHDKTRPQYTTITRQRVQRTEDENEEKGEEEENHDTNKKQYVNIRRGKVTSTTEDSEDSRTQINRNKILGEDGDEEVEADEETTKNKASTPHYVNIRRQRPSTTEETSTPKYTVIRRGTTTESETEIEVEEANKKSTTSNDVSTEKNDRKRYQILRRSTTTTEPSINESSSKRRGTTTQSDAEDKATTAPGNKYVTFKRGKPTEAPVPEVSATTPNALSSLIPEEVTDSEPENPTTSEVSSTASSASPSVSSTAQSNPESKLTDSKTPIFQTQSPVLFEPRPFSISTYGPRTNLKAVTEPTRATKVSDTNYKRLKPVAVTQSDVTTEKPTAFRTRPSRFKVTTGHPDAKTTRSRKRFSTTESYSDNYEDYDLNRSYRPSEIADLSSLTAVDLSTLKDLNRFGGGSRTRRVRPSTTTQSPEDNLKSSSRSSIARKQLSGTVIGSSRRALPKSQVEDQINSGSDTTSRIRAFTKAPLSTTTEESRSTLRNKKIVRRLRPVTKAETSTVEAENLIENASSRPLYSRRFRGSTIAEEVNKLGLTTEKLKANDEISETLEDISAEEEENIKLSESNIRENSNVNNGNNINSEDGKKVRKVLKRIRGKTDNEKVTEPNVIVRTRKIVRKLSTTEASVSITTTTEASTQNRRRKVIRRLRPTTATTPTEKTLYIRGRPFLNQITTEKSSEENEEVQDIKYLAATDKPTLDVENEDKVEETDKNEDVTKPDDPFKDAVRIQILRPVETDKAQNETELDESVEDNSEDKENNQSQDTEIITTTAKNYVNPILSRQKNRPAFRRPKLTTQSPSSSTTFGPRYRTNSRFSTTPSSTETSSETENKSAKSSSHTRSTTEPSLTEKNLVSTTQAVDSNSTTDQSIELATPQIEESDDTESHLNNSTETINSENISQTTYEYADVTQLGTSTTPSYETNVTRKDVNDTINIPAILASSEPEATTVEITTVQIQNEEETNQTVTISPEFESVNETQNHSTETTTIVSKEEASSVTTPVYHPKSTLRSILNRPKYVVPKRLTSTESPSTRARFIPRSKNRSILKASAANDLSSTTPLTPKNKFLLRYSTTERTTKITEEPEIEEYEDEDAKDADELNNRQVSSTTKSFTKKTKPRISNLPFRKTTEAPKVEEPLKDIDPEAVKNRNKNLFSSKKRKMNTPLGASTEKSEVTSEATPLTTTPVILESVTKPTKIFETTEILTTLHHIFAETELIGNATTTETPKTSSESKVEKLIEVNRIVEVHDVNDTLVQDNKVVDKVGVINRVTVVKVVDGNPSPEENEIQKANETAPEVATVKEISGEVYGVINPLEASREDRKFEVYGSSKVLDYKETGKDRKNNVAEIIDGRSNINVITPRPYYSTEASTISLEALFQKEASDKVKASSDDELLETDNSRYINVRILGKNGKEINGQKEEEYITMKAQVVEVTPKSTDGVIKIVPIQVATSRKLITPSDFDTKIENGVSKVNLHILGAKTK